MAGFTIAEAFIDLNLRATGFQRELSTSLNLVRAFGRRLVRLFPVAAASGVITGLFFGIAGGDVQVIKALDDIKESLKNLQASLVGFFKAIGGFEFVTFILEKVNNFLRRMIRFFNDANQAFGRLFRNWREFFRLFSEGDLLGAADAFDAIGDAALKILEALGRTFRLPLPQQIRRPVGGGGIEQVQTIFGGFKVRAGGRDPGLLMSDISNTNMEIRRLVDSRTQEIIGLLREGGEAFT